MADSLDINDFAKTARRMKICINCGKSTKAARGLCRTCDQGIPLAAKLRLPTYKKWFNRKNKYEICLDLLTRAKAHLEYIGYGDYWERECSTELREDLDNFFKERDEDV